MRTIKGLVLGLMAMALPHIAHASNCNNYPYVLTNGTLADATQVMANFTSILNCSNLNLAHNGANSDITSLNGLTTPISPSQGGTGNTTGQPSGAAGGVLIGTYPSPGLAAGAVLGSNIAANTVANSNLSTVTSGIFKGRATAGTGNVEDLTGTQATALLSPVVGDSGSGGTQGLVPAPASGNAAAGYALLASGVFGQIDLSKQLTTVTASGSGSWFKVGTIYVEFGVVTALGPDTTQAITLPHTLPTGCLTESVSIHNTTFVNTNDNIAELIGSCTTTSITVANNQVNGGASVDVYWIVIGN